MTANKKSYSIPFILWIIAGTVIPLASIAYYGFTSREGGFTFANIAAMFRDDHMQALGLSLSLALISTAICLVLAFPMAMVLRESKYGKQGFLIFVIILPMWMNFLLRTYAWMTLLERNGLINRFFGLFGIGPFEMINTQGAVILGMVYDFLPYMVMPIYTCISKIDKHMWEAASDLGCTPVQTLMKVILPLSMSGIISGVTMVLVPSISTFYISQKLGGGSFDLIGDTIERQFQNQVTYHTGAAVSLVMMILILISLAIMNKFSDNEEEIIV